MGQTMKLRPELHEEKGKQFPCEIDGKRGLGTG